VYARGKNRLFYQSKILEEKDVFLEITTPSLDVLSNVGMTYFEDGLYYADIWFLDLGSHVFKVYEDGEIKHKEILHVSSGKYIIYPESGRII
jgi:hypothetical protein